MADSLLASAQAERQTNAPEASGASEPAGDASQDLPPVDASQDRPLVVAAFRRALSRDPDEDEVRLACEMLWSHCAHYRSAGHGDDSRRLAWGDLCRAILNLNEFVYID
jgi:hypothetical protein